MKNTLMLLASLIVLSSCAKEEFAANKGSQAGSVSPLETTSIKACAQSTLISPKVDILVLWDNSTSFNIVTPETKASMGKLISSISERFDYHILSVPLISSDSNTLYQAQLVTKDETGLASNAIAIRRSKEQVAASLSFSLSNSAAEPGIDRATQVVSNNRSNGIFRQDAYTMIVVISNEDDDSCEASQPQVAGACADSTWKAQINTKVSNLLNLKASLNSTMMRFINISPLQACSLNGNRFPGSRYKTVAKSIYDAGYPVATDQFDNSNPDSHDLCTTSFSTIFDKVSSSIQQTLLKHKYDFWPVAAPGKVFDPDTIRVVRSDGKILTNRTGESSPGDGYAYVGLQNRNTRYAPSAGEKFDGHMIQLFGSEGNDKIVYPDCLTVTFDGVKSTYGYAYLKYGEPVVSTIQVYKSVNGSGFVAIPQSSSNGWDYVGLQFTSALDPNYKVIDLPSGANSGYFIRLNGSYKFQNSTSTTTSIRVDYNSKN